MYDRHFYTSRFPCRASYIGLIWCSTTKATAALKVHCSCCHSSIPSNYPQQYSNLQLPHCVIWDHITSWRRNRDVHFCKLIYLNLYTLNILNLSFFGDFLVMKSSTTGKSVVNHYGICTPPPPTYQWLPGAGCCVAWTPVRNQTHITFVNCHFESFTICVSKVTLSLPHTPLLYTMLKFSSQIFVYCVYFNDSTVNLVKLKHRDL